MLNLKINTGLILILSLSLIPLTTSANSTETEPTLRSKVEISCNEILPFVFREFNKNTIFFDTKKANTFEKKFRAINKAFEKIPPMVPMHDIMVTNHSLQTSLKQYNESTTHIEKLNSALESCKKDLDSYIQKT
ncbi:MAG: hypothetical protein O7C59_05480 [Rickettsia endosymbiont of Ixodes persulcatus]|nr:hypothetical protein [Rickettsia endosymbiont of Ixodes persulcatus]